MSVYARETERGRERETETGREIERGERERGDRENEYASVMIAGTCDMHMHGFVPMPFEEQCLCMLRSPQTFCW